jgi:hypothetical protein
VLAKQVLYQLNHAPSPSFFSYFWDRVSHLCLGSDCDAPIYASLVAKMTGVYHHIQLLDEIRVGGGGEEVSLTFYLGWP